MLGFFGSKLESFREKGEREKDEREDRKALTKEEIKGYREILKQYIGFAPIKSERIIGIRVTDYQITNIGEGKGRYIEIFLANGTRCFMSNDDDIWDRNMSNVYKLPDPVDDAANALSLIFPRFENDQISIHNDGFRYFDELSEFKWNPIKKDVFFIEQYIKSNTTENNDEEVFDVLMKTAEEWQNTNTLQILGREAFDAWKDILDKVYVECNRIIDEKEQIERTLKEQRKKELKEKEEQLLREKEEAEKRKKTEAIEAAGLQGELEVTYALKWLDNNYRVLSENPIKLKNANFIDEEQEFDHIVVGPVGVILIETKAYSGSIQIDENGNWNRKKHENDSWVGETNPIQQIRRHEKLLKSFLPKGIPLHSIICLAKNNVIINGIENSPLDIVKVDMLIEHIENMHSDRELDNDQISSLVELIKKYVV